MSPLWVGDTMPCFLPESNLRSGLVSQCPPLLNSIFILPGRPSPCSSQHNPYSHRVQCSELLIQLNLSLVEICFSYSLILRRGGRLSFSILDSRLQFVNGLPDSPKTEAKGVILVRGPWDETPGSPDLLFYINRSQRFPSVCRN